MCPMSQWKDDNMLNKRSEVISKWEKPLHSEDNGLVFSVLAQSSKIAANFSDSVAEACLNYVCYK